MKSSTLRRSNISREKIEMLKALAQYKSNYDSSYVQDKDRELDVLWQNFKISTKSEKTPGVYLIAGFIAGAVAMLLMTLLISFSARTTDKKIEYVAPAKVTKEQSKITFIPADKAADEILSSVVAPESYTVQSGDTLESIVIRFYGHFDLNKLEKIKVANNMSNPNALQIGQKLIIPME